MKYAKENLIRYKIIFTLFTVVVYVIGKSLPLYMIDLSAYAQKGIGAEDVLLQAISGDTYRYSLFALGISPYMISSILTQIISALQSQETKARISNRKLNRRTMGMTLLFAGMMAVVQVQELHFRVTGPMLLAAQFVAGVEMIAGAMLIIWLASRNKKYGIGGQSALILVNILDSFYSNVKGHTISELAVPLLLTFMAVAVMAILENTEKRIPVQRISVHNIYADKNYLAIKMNPIGVMPAMFSMAVFMLMQLLVNMAGWVCGNHPMYLWWKENMVLTKPMGILVYIVGLYILSVGFSRVFLNPKETMEQFLKSGDSIQNVHAGKDTKRYLARIITGLAFFSATMMAVCLALPLVLQLTGDVTGALSALPSSAMMLTGVACNMCREFVAIRNLEAYKPFI